MTERTEIKAAGFCTEHSSNSRGIGYEEDRSPTLRAGVVPGVLISSNLPVCYAEKRFFEWHEDTKSVNIRACSGSYGGEAKFLLYQKTIGTLCQTDYKWVQQQQVIQDKLICLVKTK